MQDNASQQYLPGFWCGVAGGFVHGLQLSFGCQVICILLLLLNSSHCDFIPGLPPPLALLSMW